MCYVVSLFLVVGTNTVNCLERLVSDVIYYVSSGTLIITVDLYSVDFVMNLSRTEDVTPELGFCRQKPVSARHVV